MPANPVPPGTPGSPYFHKWKLNLKMYCPTTYTTKDILLCGPSLPCLRLNLHLRSAQMVREVLLVQCRPEYPEIRVDPSIPPRLAVPSRPHIDSACLPRSLYRPTTTKCQHQKQIRISPKSTKQKRICSSSLRRGPLEAERSFSLRPCGRSSRAARLRSSGFSRAGARVQDIHKQEPKCNTTNNKQMFTYGRVTCRQMGDNQ